MHRYEFKGEKNRESTFNPKTNKDHSNHFLGVNMHQFQTKMRLSIAIRNCWISCSDQSSVILYKTHTHTKKNTIMWTFFSSILYDCTQSPLRIVSILCALCACVLLLLFYSQSFFASARLVIRPVHFER